MPTRCSAYRFGFAPIEGRTVIAAFDGGAATNHRLRRHEPDRAWVTSSMPTPPTVGAGAVWPEGRYFDP